MLKSLLCDEHNHFLVVENVEAISELVGDKHRYLWLDVERPTPEEFELIQEEFDLHPLAVEDATIRHQRPKLDQYANFYFVVFYAVGPVELDSAERAAGRAGLRGVRFHQPDPGVVDANGYSETAVALPRSDADDGSAETSWAPGQIVLRELSMFLGQNYLITVHEDPIPEFDEVAQRWFRNIEDMKAELGIDVHPRGTRQLTPMESAALKATVGNNARTENASQAQPTVEGRVRSSKRKRSRDALMIRKPPDHADESTGTQPERSTGSGILLYSLLDTLVDSYFPVIDGIVDRIEDLEEQIFERFNQAAIESVFLLKKDLLALRKVLAPERDVLNILTRRDLPIFEEHTIVYFQDVYDHIVRITDSIDTYRDLLSSALDSFLSMQSNRLNITVQTLTSVSIILMSISTFTGWYGMNFENMPELHSALGYPILILVVVIIVALEYAFFKRRGWL
jgi:Mg2+ and Co2+ transporter CorA